ncbi:MAG: acyl carrier protein [Spirochaetales bacterium]|jgi:acyl carrier protein|nr:acyl carrier protein [Spirochaetales bacterium]
MPDEASIKQQVKQTIVKALQLEVDPDEIPDDEALFGEGLDADSIATLEIVFALEQEFDIEVEDEELRVELFASVQSLVTYVIDKLRKMAKEQAISEKSPWHPGQTPPRETFSRSSMYLPTPKKEISQYDAGIETTGDTDACPVRSHEQ